MLRCRWWRGTRRTSCSCACSNRSNKDESKRERDGLGKGKNVDTTDDGSERDKIPRLKRSAASQNQTEHPWRRWQKKGCHLRVKVAATALCSALLCSAVLFL